MEQFRSIDIDFDVHKRIEMERRGFDEPPNTVLRRLLGIDPERPSEEAVPPRPAAGRTNGGASPSSPTGKPATGRPWSGKGVELPHGTDLRMNYNGRVHTARIENGQWVAEGKSFKSPSAAASGVAITKAGTHPSLDGWKYWHARLPGEHDWVCIDKLRRRAREPMKPFSLDDF